MDDQTKNLIKSHIDTNEVCLFMKGTPDAPQCGFSMAVYSPSLFHREHKAFRRLTRFHCHDY